MKDFVEQNNKESQEKQLPDIFKELKQMRTDNIINEQVYNQSIYEKAQNRFLKSIVKFFNSKRRSNYYIGEKSLVFPRITSKRYNRRFETDTLFRNLRCGFTYNFSKMKLYISDLAKTKLKGKRGSIVLTIAAFFLLFSFSSLNNYMLATDIDKDIEEPIVVGEFESNENPIDIMSVLSQNISVTKRKEVTTEEHSIEFKTTYRENGNLPKDESVLVQEGINGRENITFIRTLENDEVTEERIINKELIEDYVEEIIEVGTSEFLAKYKVHLGDVMYLKEDTLLMDYPRDDANEFGTIGKNLDVKLLEASDIWCKIEFWGYQGYIKSSVLTSEFVTPGIAELSRKTKILMKVNFDMSLNSPSGLSLEDFRKVLSGESRDTNKIFENCAEAFYNMEQKYNINGIFLASVGIHESGWGTSRISLEKKNLFGYGAYDRDPYNFAFTFDTYEEGIELLAKVFVRYYLNVSGTPIYDNMTAQGTYYNGPTVSGINVRYASDTGWAEKVYKTMEYLYSKL